MLNVSRPVAYLILAISICIELIGDAALEACNGYENKALSIFALVFILFSFFLFSKILHIINIAIAYATWSSLGALISAMIGLVIFDQHLTLIGWVSIIVLAIGTIVIDLWGTPKDEIIKEDTHDPIEEGDVTCQ